MRSKLQNKSELSEETKVLYFILFFFFGGELNKGRNYLFIFIFRYVEKTFRDLEEDITKL